MPWKICFRSRVLRKVSSHRRLQIFWFLTLFKCSEVEKQLQGNEFPMAVGTPHMSYKKSHSGSTGNLHGLVGLSDQNSTGENYF